jgi:hypothetical protein
MMATGSTHVRRCAFVARSMFWRDNPGAWIMTRTALAFALSRHQFFASRMQSLHRITSSILSCPRYYQNIELQGAQQKCSLTGNSPNEDQKHLRFSHSLQLDYARRESNPRHVVGNDV